MKPKLKGFAVIPKHIALKIQRKGGKAVSKDRKHMAAIGALGGKA